MISELEHRSVLSLRLSYSNFFPRLPRDFTSPFSTRILLSILSSCPGHSIQWLCACGPAWNPTSMLAGSQVCLHMQLSPVPKPCSSLGTVRIGNSQVCIRTILAGLSCYQTRYSPYKSSLLHCAIPCFSSSPCPPLP